ncbi:hypothetical protein IWW34DRAFT_823934 [Fusarium oxysporum f. sp. albedinis]|nr:hypothetical protein IWW34DRAFT_823934 [Fusarium oxysporum f. sp. albedinis]
MEPRGTKRAGNSTSAGSNKRRGPYAIRACLTCRHRKGKCDGRLSCGYCDNRGQACIYDVADLRAQLNNVESIVQAYAKDVNDTGKDPTHSEPLHQADQAMEGPNAHSSQRQASLDRSDSSSVSRVFCGPTSPDYSMNVVQMTLQKRGYLEPSRHRPALPSFDWDHVSPSTTSQWQPSCQVDDRRQLLLFRSYLTLQDAKEVVSVYSEVVGELHSFVDIKNIQGHSSLDSTKQQSDYHDLVIFNLMLLIAVNAGMESLRARPAGAMHSVFQRAVNTSITAYQPRLALRMCGNAGRIFMELGIHNSDVIKHDLASEAQRKEASTLMCCVIVLDRQWSAMTGLPPNFAHNTFSVKSTHLGSASSDSPYTMAMYRLVLISDKFNEPIALAAKGSSHQDDDAVELMVFQIQQWQKKFVGDRELSDMKTWLAQPSFMPPSWVLLLIFRAVSIRSLLFRPYFFPGSRVERSKQHISPATELLSHSIEALSKLDSTTGIYRKQRPYYQHILASICSLVFLLTGYVEDHRPALCSHLPPDFDYKIRCCLQTASNLTGKYASISAAAHRLWKRTLERNSTSTIENDSRSMNTVATPKKAPMPLPVVQDEVAITPGNACEADTYLIGANLGLEPPIEIGNCLSQDFQALLLPAWPSTDSYLFH